MGGSKCHLISQSIKADAVKPCSGPTQIEGAVDALASLTTKEVPEKLSLSYFDAGFTAGFVILLESERHFRA